MKETLETVLLTFQKSCEEHAKLFIPEPRQDQVVESLVNYYDKYFTMEILLECIRTFVKEADDPILVYDFALSSSKIRDKVIERQRSKEEFNTLVKQTEERMRQFDEL
jgi:hypothetical protein